MKFEPDWKAEFSSGYWHRVTFDYHSPSLRTPMSMLSRYNRSGITYMPGGPYVVEYSFSTRYDTDRGPWSEPAVVVDCAVTWKPEIQEAIKNRNILLGEEARKVLDAYHGQIAIAYTKGLLNQNEKKIGRAKLVWAEVKRLHDETPQEWFDMYHEWVHDMREAMVYDESYVMDYAKQHALSAVVPSTRWTKGKHWNELFSEDFVHMFNVNKARIEDIDDHWETEIKKIWPADMIGGGIRARSPDVPSILQRYLFKVDQARDVGYNFCDSPTWAFIKEDKKQAGWNKILQFAEKKLACKIYLPPVEQGSWWQKMGEAIDKYGSWVSGDGSTWDMHSATLSGMYCYSVDKGFPSWISGTFPTSQHATWTMLQRAYVQEGIGKTKSMEVIGGVGDDQTFIGSKQQIEKIREYPNIWEIDPIATKYKCFLGVVILPDGKGTFPGLNRITVDRAEKKQPSVIGDTVEHVKSDIPEDSFNIYRQIQEHGEINSHPMLSYIAKREDLQFYEMWRMNRDNLMQSLGTERFEVVFEDDIVL